MKTFSISLKTIAILLSMLTLQQSCVVYNKTPVNLDQAVEASKETIKYSKSKIFYKDGKTQKCFKVVKEQNNYYCENSSKTILNFAYKKELINKKDEIDFVKTQNKTSSFIGDIIITLVIFPPLLFGLVLVSN